MNITLTHCFLHQAHDLPGLLDGCVKLSTFKNRLQKQALLHPNRYDPNLYVGDGFELFVEALIKLSPVDNRIGISDYQCVEDQDVGVDGSGTGFNGKPATVQVKFRGDGSSVLTANNDHLSNFTSASVLHFGVAPEDNKNMLIVTTAKGLHHFTDNEMYSNKVRCLGWEQLRELVDNNQAFWDSFRRLVEESGTTEVTQLLVG